MLINHNTSLSNNRLRLNQLVLRCIHIDYSVIDYLKQYFVWEKYLLNAFLAITIKKKNEFESYEITILPKSTVRTHIKYLKENGYTQHINTIKGRKIYKITNTGLNLAKKIETNIRSYDTNLLNELNGKITKRIRN